MWGSAGGRKSRQKRRSSRSSETLLLPFGITGLIDAVVNKAPIMINILDNRITAMTGHQENPGTGRIDGRGYHQVDLKSLYVACVKEEGVRLIDP